MSVRPTLLKDMRRTAIDNHQQATGSGNYNRFTPLAPRDRSVSVGKRQRPQEPMEPTPKTPRLDANVVFAQLKENEPALQVAKDLLTKAAATCEECCSSKDGAMGSIIHSLLQVMTTLLISHENLSSAIIDSVKLVEKPTPSHGGARPKDSQHSRKMDSGAGASSSQPPRFVPPTQPAPSEEDLAKRKVRQSLREAEKRTIIFNLDLGQVPTINKDTLSRKVTMALSEKAKTEKHDYNIADAEEAIDDLLSCSKLEFLGNQTRKYFNKRKPTDPLNNKFCTVPVRMDFKTKETRIQAEISLRKLCKVSCSTPYPKRLRGILDNLVKEGKTKSPDCFIRTRVNVDNLTIDVHAKIGKDWKDLGLSCNVPLNILDREEALSYNTIPETMDESDAPPLS